MASEYDQLCDFQNLYSAHKAARRGKRGKLEVIDFEMNLAANLCKLQTALTNKTYTPKGYNHFKIYEPKEREIFAPSYADRVVQHCLCDNILMPALETRLIFDNAACRKNKGTHFAMNRLVGFMRDVYRVYGTQAYFLKCDIRKYFENIDHVVLKKKLYKIWGNTDVWTLLIKIIDSYENTLDVGLPLGNQTSQWFALYYLDGVDRLIKEKLQIKYYSRYMDDSVLIHHSKEYLMQCLSQIQDVCENDLHIQLNDKTQIFPIKNGVDYLGWHFYLTDTGKIIRKLRTSNKTALKRRIKKSAKDYHDYSTEMDSISRSAVSTYGHLKHGHTYRLRNKLSWETVYSRTQHRDETMED